jgi:hypothetical protein
MLFARKNELRIFARLGTEQTEGWLEEQKAPETERAAIVNGDTAEALLFSPIRMAGNVRGESR